MPPSHPCSSALSSRPCLHDASSVLAKKHPVTHQNLGNENYYLCYLPLYNFHCHFISSTPFMTTIHLLKEWTCYFVFILSLCLLTQSCGTSNHKIFWVWWRLLSWKQTKGRVHWSIYKYKMSWKHNNKANSHKSRALSTINVFSNCILKLYSLRASHLSPKYFFSKSLSLRPHTFLSKKLKKNEYKSFQVQKKVKNYLKPA